ncbi:ATP-binding protein [Furfurilactobacillus rossiae]|uniref:Carbamoyl-phosphate synthase large subunit n=1 Tax=Furfurilactobacillus rossiae DSM 15814 TaxID=1114972 RepID=A0A0R1RKN9_9LACO|nr:ATP-grasp domain-containing protein [Furfurilactobacillus rossiae]KRL57260.1 carbamoyl-phosphate synthase large subunit [Furfurilactobacillus rossiae DSM 15814]MCF6164995.1 ATP-grasp domain-containing protein [Furfurilactobacillus rossiae]QFR65861.1 ATP-grasp domain-containing protein [Furfurilactobacillus rossiae]QLE61273.1 Carbamoyl-phosphate synthase large chain [Furfurilactobacillus rossiae]QLE64067.1 Carbamoyl-phosphate synthase large chain [Furfurilactobacillus rossiae]
MAEETSQGAQTTAQLAAFNQAEHSAEKTASVHQRLLVIGDGPNDFGHETELDAATYQTLSVLHKHNYDTVYLNNNPFSFSMENACGATVIMGDPSDVATVRQVIESEHITSIVPTVGGLTAMRTVEELIAHDYLDDKHINVLGMPLTTVRLINNPALMNQTLRDLGEPVITSQVASTTSDAFDIARQVGFPVIVKSVAPRGEGDRVLAENADQLDAALSAAFERSRTRQVIVDQSIVGLKEVSFEVLRDARGTELLLGAMEDMDPVGIHAADSIEVTPIQTLTDREYQKLRQAAFRVARRLHIVGVMHVQFALDPVLDNYFIMKVNPYYDRVSAMLSRASGYPIALVAANVMTGISLPEVRLSSRFAKRTALIEPVLDHVVVRFPIFAFDEAERRGVKVDRQLTTVQKSVGATLGIGRSLEEAMLKAMRAAHYHNRDFAFDALAKLSDNDLIQQLIHPHDNRMMLLLEAIRRGYQSDELAELTQIDEFYFHKLRNIYNLEVDIAAHSGSEEWLQRAKYYGFSDGLIAQLWQTNADAVMNQAHTAGIIPTYKTVEPTAGEFSEVVPTFYSTYELENESRPLADNTALVVTTGAFRLGDGAAGEYVMSTVISELHQQGIKTVVVNNNPNAISLIPQLTDKQYLEPQEISDILGIIDLEHPRWVFVPGNRLKLIGALRLRHINVIVINKDKASKAAQDGDQFLTRIVYHTNKIGVADPAEVAQTDYHAPTHRLVVDNQGVPGIDAEPGSMRQSGFYNTLFSAFSGHSRMVTTALPFPEFGLLNKGTGINWIRMLVRALLDKTTAADRRDFSQGPFITATRGDVEMVDIPADLDRRWHANLPLVGAQFKLGAKINVKFPYEFKIIN